MFFPPNKLLACIPTLHLYLLEVNWLANDLVVLWQLFTGRQYHEDASDLSASAVPVVHSHIPQLHQHTGQLGGNWGSSCLSSCLLTLRGRFREV